MNFDDPAFALLDQEIAGRYRVERLIGKGGAGAVYQATQLGLDRQVAIKLLHPRSAANDETRKRFIREARITSQLRHTHAIKIFDFGEHENQLYIVMELLTGRSLRAAISKRAPGMPRKRALTLALQIADVLQAAHAIQLVHRDLKPENVMLDRDSAGAERAVVVDFGLAFIDDQEREELGRLTTTGILVGTPAYLSPEQAQGLTITPASDIYSFGCLLYEMLCGSPPYRSSTVIGIVNQHLYVDAPSLRETYPSLEIPHDLNQLLLKTMSKEPSQRPEAAQLHALLERMLTGGEPGDSPEARGRGRSGRDLRPRHERLAADASDMATIVPGAGPMNPIITQTASGSQTASPLETIALLDHPCDGDLGAALATQQLRGVTTDVEGLDQLETAVVFAPNASTATIEALTRTGRVVVTTAAPGDLTRIQELIRAGAADVVPHPPKHNTLARKLARALRKSKTPRTT
ncbi:MAG: hypothetical protein CMH57_02930 [Myxococcales bacterium]|nr:hypothetical protein [Myxococcales bacterium]